MLRELARDVRHRLNRPEDYETVVRNARDDRHLRVVLAAVLRSDDRCVDVGANVGGVLQQIVTYAPDGRHLAIEAIPGLADQLRTRFPSADVHAVAASDHTGETTFVHAVDRPALSGMREGKTAGHQVEHITVPVRRLDDLVDFAPALVKVDVEGAELEVLRGAERVLSTGPVVVFEHSNRLAHQFGTEPEQVHDMLTSVGMRIYDMDGEGPLSRTQFAAMFHTHDRFNWMARP